MFIAMAFIILYIYGPDILKSPENVRVALMFEPVAITFEVFLFIWFRNRIRKSPIPTTEEDESPNPDNPDDKKDLSYFR